MRIFLRKILVKVLSKKRQKYLKNLEYKSKKALIEKLPKISEEKLISILTKDLGIKSGDNLFIHASLDMINTNLSPLDILNIILDIVGEQGSISVPTFTRYLSKDWMLMEKDFHIKRTPSGMGIFSERVRRHKLSSRSIHPTKSIASIGAISKEITSEHHTSKYPFGIKSPFFKLMKEHNVKIIGLGAPMSYLSMVHVVEDVYNEEYPMKINEDIVYEKNCILNDNKKINVKTYIHDLSILAKANPEKFIKKFVSIDKYKIFNHYLSPFFVVEGENLLSELKKQMSKGNTIYN